MHEVFVLSVVEKCVCVNLSSHETWTKFRLPVDAKKPLYLSNKSLSMDSLQEDPAWDWLSTTFQRKGRFISRHTPEQGIRQKKREHAEISQMNIVTHIVCSSCSDAS